MITQGISKGQDIFGKSIEDYKTINDAKAKNTKFYDAAARLHEQGVKTLHQGWYMDKSTGQRVVIKDATDGGFGFLTNNLSVMILPIQEILFRSFDFSQFVPVRTNVPVNAGFYERLVIESFGVAKRLDLTGNNAENSGSAISRRFAKTYVSGINAFWTNEELRLAVNLGKPLTTILMEAALVADLQKLRRQSLVGIPNEPDDISKLAEGLLNFSTIDIAASGVDWSTITESTANTLIASVQDFISAFVQATQEITTTNPMFNNLLTLATSPAGFDKLAQTKDGNFRDKTVLQTLATNNAWTQRLAGTGVNGAADANNIPAAQQLQFRSILELDDKVQVTGRAVLYFNNINVCEIAVPQMPRAGTPLRGLRDTTVPVDMLHGTFQFSQEKMALYIDGIGL